MNKIVASDNNLDISKKNDGLNNIDKSKKSPKKLKKKSEKLIKYNRKKIIIISVIVLGIIAGISVGIYYAVQQPDKKFSKNVSKVSAQTARNKVEKMEVDDVMGIYLYDQSSDIDKQVVYGENEDGSFNYQSLEGPFSKYTEDLVTNSAEWIAFSASDQVALQKKVSHFLFGKDKNNPEPIFTGSGSVYYNLGEISGDFTTDWENSTGQGEPMNGVISGGDVWNDNGYWEFELSNAEAQGATWIWIKGGDIKFVNVGINADILEQDTLDSSYWLDAEDLIDTL